MEANKQLNINSYFDKIFYINLAKDADRDKGMVAQFKKYAITNYERVDAIEITTLPDIGQYRNFIKKDMKYIMGNISCRASHKKCIELAKARNYSKILILEGDAHFLQNPNTILILNDQNLGDWDMLYFGGLVEPHYRNQIVCSHAYAVKKSIFDDILYMVETSGMEIDNFYAKILQHMSYNYNQSGKYNIRMILPFNQIVQNKSFESNIQC